jgi:formylglycine-generating enzyme required for sulfatase activity
LQLRKREFILFIYTLTDPMKADKNKVIDQKVNWHEQRTALLSLVGLVLLTVIIISAFEQQRAKPGKTFRDCPECPLMVKIPAGTFTIGSPPDEPGRTETEGPEKQISIKAFAAGRFDVTRGQWAAFVKATKRDTAKGCAFSGFKNDNRKDWESNPDASWANLGFAQDDNHPVVCLTWQDAQDYVTWLSRKTGGRYRLLTEAEWEYAARAGTTTPYPWGTVPSHEYANYGADSGYTGLASGRDKWANTSPVGSFPPNAFGLYDMNGNVLQYVEDCFSGSYSGLPLDGSPYTADIKLSMTGRYSFMNGTSSCASRMVRGGDWGDPPRMIRSGFRNWAPGRGFTLATYRSAGAGFRVAKSL